MSRSAALANARLADIHAEYRRAADEWARERARLMAEVERLRLRERERAAFARLMALEDELEGGRP